MKINLSFKPNFIIFASNLYDYEKDKRKGQV